jgi:arsenite methyltransferase
MSDDQRSFSNLLAMRILPHRFLATQLRKPSGRFGRWVMTRALNDGNAEMIAATLEALTLRPNERFLDVGFGGGLAITRAATQTEGALWGVDFAPDMVSAGARTLAPLIAAGRLNLLRADVADLPLRDGIVDAICTTNTIYFWPDLAKALAELLRLLAPYGRLAIGYTGAEKMRRFEPITSHGFRTFEPAALESALKSAGFRRITTRALAGKVTKGDYVTVAHS